MPLLFVKFGGVDEVASSVRVIALRNGKYGKIAQCLIDDPSEGLEAIDPRWPQSSMWSGGGKVLQGAAACSDISPDGTWMGQADKVA